LWTDEDVVAHELRASEYPWRGLDHRKDPRKELRGTKVREAVMASFVVLIIALFLAGVVTGAIALVAFAVRREDRQYSLIGEAPDRLSRGARRLNGVGRRDLDSEFLRPMAELIH
jgi:hypothetical protein